MKKTQLIMLWFFPIILIGGLFIPWLGYLVIAMMAFFLVLSYFKGRYWCSHLCPRGAFLDIVMVHMSPQKPLPKIFTNKIFRWSIVYLFIAIIIIRIIYAQGDFLAIGAIIVNACLITSLIAVGLGVTTKHRGWCAICPMGTIQGRLGQIKKESKTPLK